MRTSHLLVILSILLLLLGAPAGAEAPPDTSWVMVDKNYNHVITIQNYEACRSGKVKCLIYVDPNFGVVIEPITGAKSLANVLCPPAPGETSREVIQYCHERERDHPNP